MAYIYQQLPIERESYEARNRNKALLHISWYTNCIHSNLYLNIPWLIYISCICMKLTNWLTSLTFTSINPFYSIYSIPYPASAIILVDIETSKVVVYWFYFFLFYIFYIFQERQLYYNSQETLFYRGISPILDKSIDLCVWFI